MRSLIPIALALIAGCAPNDPWSRSTIAYESSFSTSLMDLYRPKNATGPLPTVFFIHGGAFMAGGRSDGRKYADVLCRKGLAIVSVDYRLTSSGATWPAPQDDVRSALRYLSEHATGLGVGKIGVMGASAGACLASFLHFTSDRIDGVKTECLVDISGEVDLRLGPAQCFSNYEEILTRLFGHPLPISDSEKTNLSPVLDAHSDAHVLIVHSTGDSNVYIAQSDSFAQELSSVGADFRYLRRSGYAHGDDLWQQDGEARAEVAAFLLDHLR